MKNGKYVLKGGIFHYKDDKYHRLDGPAIEQVNGKRYWFINGNHVKVKSQEEFEKSIEYKKWKLKAFW